MESPRPPISPYLHPSRKHTPIGHLIDTMIFLIFLCKFFSAFYVKVSIFGHKNDTPNEIRFFLHDFRTNNSFFRNEFISK